MLKAAIKKELSLLQKEEKQLLRNRQHFDKLANNRKQSQAVRDIAEYSWREIEIALLKNREAQANLNRRLKSINTRLIV